MRTITPRSLYQEVPSETSVVVIDGEIVGTFVPVAAAPPDAVAGGPAADLTRAVARNGAITRMGQAERDKVLRRMTKGGSV